MRASFGKKVEFGIVTFYHENYNFGGLLQAYALPAALERYLNIASEQIDYLYVPKKQARAKEAISLKKIIYTAGFLFFNQLAKNNFAKRKAAFDRFAECIPHSVKRYDYNSISDAKTVYKGFICGGDQIWTDCLRLNWFRIEDSNVFTLQFVPEDRKKIAYAPSMAVQAFSDEFATEFSRGINRLDAVSVREESSLPVLKQITNKPITVVVDPVLLLEESDWLSEMRCPSNREKYVLCYLLGDSHEQRKASKKFARKVNCRMMTFPHVLFNIVRKCDLFFGDIRDYASGPREFLGLIKNAEFVITDSFHACVFSMIFRTPFAVFERDKANRKGNMNSRIYDFLEEYHLERQLVTEETLAGMNEIPKVDFSYAHQHWKRRREESLEYLRNALKGSENGAEG